MIGLLNFFKGEVDMSILTFFVGLVVGWLLIPCPDIVAKWWGKIKETTNDDQNIGT